MLLRLRYIRDPQLFPLIHNSRSSFAQCKSAVQEADLSEAVRDAIILALPNGALCGEPSCISTAQRGVGLSGQRSGWVSASSSPASEAASSSQFSMLQKLREQL